MNWRGSRAESRERYLAKFDAAEAEEYHSFVGVLDPEDAAAYREDLACVFTFRSGMAVLDAGAGTGTMCRVLAPLEGLDVTALEPAPAMLEKVREDPELVHVTAVEGFCDAPEDRGLFEDGRFDVIVSRQLANGLWDPLAAFRNWFAWLKPGGAVVLIDGFYTRDAWRGVWAEEVDVLPLSACQSTAAAPYLLEAVGFDVTAVERMTAANARPITRTERYVVAARKPDGRAGTGDV